MAQPEPQMSALIAAFFIIVIIIVIIPISCVRDKTWN